MLLLSNINTHFYDGELGLLSSKLNRCEKPKYSQQHVQTGAVVLKSNGAVTLRFRLTYTLTSPYETDLNGRDVITRQDDL